MQNFDFLANSLVWPVYFGLVTYGFAWVGARFFAGILAKRIGSERGGTERGTVQAWRMMIILHLIASIIFAGYLCFRALPRVEAWTETLWHLVSFLPFLVLDVCLLISLASQGPKKQKKRQ